MALLVDAAGLGPVWQFAAFVVVSVILLVFTRPWALKYMKPRLVKTNYEAAVDKNVCLTEAVDNIKGNRNRRVKWTGMDCARLRRWKNF